MASPCPPSADSASKVDSCPMTWSEWNQRALQKSCSSFPQTCQKPLEYHCILNPFRNESLEVCAPNTWLVEEHCPSYSIKFQRISDQFNCSTLFSDCPKNQYFSNTILNYSGCLLQGGRSITPDLPLPSSGTIVYFITYLLISALITCFLIWFLRKHKYQRETADKSSQLSSHLPLDEESSIDNRSALKCTEESQGRISLKSCENIELSEYHEEISEISTNNLALKLKLKSSLRSGIGPHLVQIYDVPYRVERDEKWKICKYRIGGAHGEDLIGKYVLIVSTPHSGKTTLLQGILNVFFGVSYNDDFRLGLSPEIIQKRDQYQDWVNVYQILEYKGGDFGLPLTLIDIPRPSKSEEMRKRTKEELIGEIYQQLKSILSMTKQCVDCICFVTKASDYSLPRDEIEYIKAICHLFQCNPNTDLCCFFTFSDGGPVLVHEFLKSSGVGSNREYVVNGTSFNQRNSRFPHIIWDTNVKQLNKFFTHLKESVPKVIRDSLTDDSLTESIKDNLSTLQFQINENLEKLAEIITLVNIYTEQKDVILSDGDITFPVDKIKQKKIPIKHPGVRTTNCMQCLFICHEHCAIPDENIRDCSAMRDGYCTVCTDKCVWTVHRNLPFTYEYENVHETKSYQEMKNSYEQIKGKVVEYHEYLENLSEDIAEVSREIYSNLREITQRKIELLEIQRHPQYLSLDDTINVLINAERANQKKGFERRIYMYEKHIKPKIKLDSIT